MQRKTILLIDDSETILTLERQILGPHYDLIMAKDGLSGVAQALAGRPDLILLDLVMPGMNGLDVCEILRKNDATKRTPILVITSLIEAQRMTARHRTGWSGHVPKPIHGPQLLATVRSYLEE